MGWGWGRGREIIYLSLHCHHQNDSCIKTGSDESHFIHSLIVRDKVTRQCTDTTTFLKRKESRSGIEPRPFCPFSLSLSVRLSTLTPYRWAKPVNFFHLILRLVLIILHTPPPPPPLLLLIYTYAINSFLLYLFLLLLVAVLLRGGGKGCGWLG